MPKKNKLLNLNLHQNHIKKIGEHYNAVSYSKLKAHFPQYYEQSFQMQEEFLAEHNSGISLPPKLNLIFFLLLLQSLCHGASLTEFNPQEKKFVNDCLNKLPKDSIYFQAEKHFNKYSAHGQKQPFLQKVVCREEDCKEAIMGYHPASNNIQLFKIYSDQECKILEHEGTHYAMGQISANGERPSIAQRNENILVGDVKMQKSGIEILKAYHLSLLRIQEALTNQSHPLLPKVLEFLNKLHNGVAEYKSLSPQQLGNVLLAEKGRMDYYLERYCSGKNYCKYAVGEAIANSANTCLTPFIGEMQKMFAPEVKLHSAISPDKKVDLLTAVKDHMSFYRKNLQTQIDSKGDNKAHLLSREL